jgi:hypothetical protein
LHDQGRTDDADPNVREVQAAHNMDEESAARGAVNRVKNNYSRAAGHCQRFFQGAFGARNIFRQLVLSLVAVIDPIHPVIPHSDSARPRRDVPKSLCGESPTNTHKGG